MSTIYISGAGFSKNSGFRNKKPAIDVILHNGGLGEYLSFISRGTK